MAKIINLPQESALLMNEFKKSVRFMQGVNGDGKYNDQISIERSAMRHEMNTVLGRKAEAA